MRGREGLVSENGGRLPSKAACRMMVIIGSSFLSVRSRGDVVNRSRPYCKSILSTGPSPRQAWSTGTPSYKVNRSGNGLRISVCVVSVTSLPYFVAILSRLFVSSIRPTWRRLLYNYNQSSNDSLVYHKIPYQHLATISPCAQHDRGANDTIRLISVP